MTIMKKFFPIMLMALLSATVSNAAESLTRYYIFHAGELAATEATCIDYCPDIISSTDISFPGFYPEWNGWQYVPTMNRQDSQESLWLNSQFADYWGAAFTSTQPLSLKGTNADWTLHLRMKTNCPNTIKFALNKDEQEVAYYDFTAGNSKYSNQRDGETWNDIAIPLSEFKNIATADYDDAFTGTFFSIAGTGQTLPETSTTIFVAFEEIYLEGMADLTVLEKEELELADILTLNEDKAFTTLRLTSPSAQLTLANGISVTADEVIADIDIDGSAPQIVLGDGAKLTAKSYIVNRKVKGGQWNLLASPAPFAACDVTATGAELTKLRHTSVKHIDYNSDGNSIWQVANDADMIYPAADRERQQLESYAIAVKADNDAIVEIRGGKTVLTGTDHLIANAWQDGNANVHNFNLVAHPYTSNYCGIFRSDNEEEIDPNAQQGVITYIYDADTDCYKANLTVDQTPTYQPYTPFFTQCYAYLSAPRQSITATPADYTQFSITFGNDEVRFIEQPQSTDGYDENIDAVKLFGFNNATPAVYAIDNDNVRTAVSAHPSLENASLRFGIKVPEAGTYTFTYHGPEGYHLSVQESNANKNVELHDGDTYEFSSNISGVLDYRFNATFAADQPVDDTTDAILSITASTKSATPSVYTLNGQKLPNAATMQKGVYVINGKQTMVR